MPANVSAASVANTKAVGSSGSRELAKESAAIVKFIEKNWSVKVDKGSLTQLVNHALEHGMSMGDRYGKAELRSRLESANRMVTVANALSDGKDLKPLKLPLDAGPIASFGDEADKLEKSVKARFDVTAKPKGKLPADEFAVPVEAPFSGVDLHPSLAASVGGFSVTMSPQTVKYNLERDRSPLNTMLSAIVRQGMSLAIADLDATYGKKIDGLQAKAQAAIDRSSDGFTTGGTSKKLTDKELGQKTREYLLANMGEDKLLPAVDGGNLGSSALILADKQAVELLGHMKDTLLGVPEVQAFKLDPTKQKLFAVIDSEDEIHMHVGVIDRQTGKITFLSDINTVDMPEVPNADDSTIAHLDALTKGGKWLSLGTGDAGPNWWR